MEPISTTAIRSVGQVVVGGAIAALRKQIARRGAEFADLVAAKGIERELNEALAVLRCDDASVPRQLLDRFKAALSQRPAAFADPDARRFIAEDEAADLVKAGARNVLQDADVAEQLQQARRLHAEMFGEDGAYGERLAEDAIAFAVMTVLSPLAPDTRLLIEVVMTSQASLVAGLKSIAKTLEAREAARDAAGSADTKAGAGRLRSRGFVGDAAPDNLPDRLMGGAAVLFRDTEAERLEQLLSQFGGGTRVCLRGDPGSGKSFVLRKFAARAAREGGPAHHAALLHVNLSHSRGGPLRAFDNALRPVGENPDWSAGRGGESDSDDEAESSIIQYIADLLPRHTGRNGLILIIEEYSWIAASPTYKEELRALLDHPVFRAAFGLVETRGEELPAALGTTPELALLPLNTPEAIHFLVSQGQDGEVAAAAIRATETPSDAYLRYPGILCKGAVRYAPQLRLPGEPGPTPDELYFAWIEEEGRIAGEVLGRVCERTGCDAEGVTVSLLALSVVPEASVTEDLIEEAGLAPIPFEALDEIRWLERTEGWHFLGFARQALRAAAELRLREEARTGGTRLHAAVLELCHALFRRPTPLPPALLDEAIGWLRRRLPDHALIADLEALLAQVAVLDHVFPFSAQEERAAAPQFLDRGRDGDLDKALAALVLFARTRDMPGDRESPESRSGFLESAKLVAELEEQTGQILWRQLSALDSALFFGARYRHLFRETLGVRQRLLQSLERQVDQHEADWPWLYAWMSFLINTANLSVSLEGPAEISALMERLEPLLARHQRQGDFRWHWLSTRLWMLRERLSTGLADRVAALREAERHAAACLAAIPADPRSARFYLRMSRYLLRQQSDDSERHETVELARARIEAVIGPLPQWPIAIKAQVAALMRDEARRAFSIGYQNRRARDALNLLRAGADDKSSALAQDPEALLVEARLLAFLGKHKEALKSCKLSLDLAPRASAWHLNLRLLDSAGGGREQGPSNLEPIDWTKGAVSPQLRKAITQLRELAARQDPPDRAFGKVLLWADQRIWRSQGSIERCAADRAREHDQIEYNSLTKERRVPLINKIYHERMVRIRRLERTYGKSIHFTIASFRNEAQYQRSLAILERRQPDIEPVMNILDEGLALWPDSHVLTMYKGEYLRYIWRNREATEYLRLVAHQAPNGDLRRQAALALAKTLYSDAVNRNPKQAPDLEARNAALAEARTIVEDLVGQPGIGREVALLRDHISLETGGDVDWSALEDAYDLCVDGIDGFPNALLSHLGDIQTKLNARPGNVAEAVLENFGDPDTLGFAGTLYLRRAELGKSNNTLDDLLKSVALFLAEAMLERSIHNCELPTTSFRIGYAILKAVETEQSVNPLPGLSLEDNADQLGLAIAKFTRTIGSSTGEFQALVRRFRNEAEKQRIALQE